MPTPTHSPAAYWLLVDERPVLLDPGPGALVRLLASPLGPDSLDAVQTVLFSHLHLDHCADLAPLLFALHSPVLRAETPVQLIGPPGLARYLERLRDLYGDWLQPARRQLLLTEIQPGQFLTPAPGGGPAWEASPTAEGTTIRAFAAEHPQDRFCEVCLCLRFTDRQGHRVVFSGDTEPCAGLTEASRQADLLIVECSTPDAWALPGHMTPDRVGRLCAATAPRQVVLTHQYPAAAALDLAGLIAAHYGGPVIPAVDGAHFTVPQPGVQGKRAR